MGARRQLNHEVLDVARVPAAVREEMFWRFTEQYAEVELDIFLRDLAAKRFVLVVREPAGLLVGFSTLAVDAAEAGGERLRYIFSGDTFLDQRYWGDTTLLRQWFRLAGRIRAEDPSTSLYWFLITKGHRTFRILTSFFVDYVPHRGRRRDGRLEEIRNVLGRQRFGDYFDPRTGLIDFGASRGQLQEDLADADRYARINGNADFFLACNPDYARGVELACIGQFETGNLRKYAARMFAEGLAER
jgi:hypothetical protein